MQSFASPPSHTPTPIPHPTKITHHILYHAPQKGRNYRLYPRPFYQKNTERAQLSLIPTPFLPKKP